MSTISGWKTCRRFRVEKNVGKVGSEQNVSKFGPEKIPASSGRKKMPVFSGGDKIAGKPATAGELTGLRAICLSKTPS